MPTKLDDAIKQSLSAMLDNEHSEMDLRRVLKRAEQDDAVLEQWANLHESRSALQKESGPTCSANFVSNIQAAIEKETDITIAANDSSFSKQLRTFSSKFAVAASITFAVLIGVNQLGVQQPSDGALEFADANAAKFEPMAVVPPGFEAPALSLRAVSSAPAGYASGFDTSYRTPVAIEVSPSKDMTPEVRAQLNRLMFKHAESVSATGGLSVLPLMRVSSLESDTIQSGTPETQAPETVEPEAVEKGSEAQ